MWIYTDGACKGNPGPGGWGFCVIPVELPPLNLGLTYADVTRLLRDLPVVYANCGGLSHTTNNVMEMKGLLEALVWISDNPGDYTLISDSSLVVKGMNEWLPKWKRQGFRGIKNRELWMEISELYDTLPPQDFKWVKGHAGNLGNELADRLANEGVPDVQSN